ncbi:hypothetical protein GA0061094_0555 [[Bacillus] enclensis]|uniref:Uncharacterized protein n=1 Tax=[Bacillus] enclensis TaxID=1402860 RepID=A0A1C3ZBQ4_9BACI|nr:hypothetical protein GA0061094_0555 [[Bacillus] enclensis]
MSDIQWHIMIDSIAAVVIIISISTVFLLSLVITGLLGEFTIYMIIYGIVVVIASYRTLFETDKEIEKSPKAKFSVNSGAFILRAIHLINKDGSIRLQLCVKDIGT